MPRKFRTSRSKSTIPTAVFEAAVEEIGARGDGIVRHDGKPVFVPRTVPGDVVRARIEGKRGDGLFASVLDVLTPGPGRVQPPCPHAGVCGGCSLQHWDAGLIGGWKRDQLAGALARAGVADEAVRPTLSLTPGTRRRATFAYQKRGRRVWLGFNEQASHRLVEIGACLLLAPPLNDLLDPLRALVGAMKNDEAGDISVTLTEAGLDLVIGGGTRLDLAWRERLAAFADQHDLARLSWQAGTEIELVAERRQPIVRFGDVDVVLPPASFLQPSREGEAALASLACPPLAGCARVADLFAGSGSFSFVLARHSEVLAIEGDEAAHLALKAASGRAMARVTAERRDLFRQPLIGDEMKRLNGLLFDPPRAGAAAQAEQLAIAGPPVVVAVSCNPASLARDARALIGGGYRLIWATPVDQFPFSPHIEAVALFER